MKKLVIALAMVVLTGCAGLAGKECAKVSPPAQPTRAEILAEARQSMELDGLRAFWDNELLTLRPWLESKSPDPVEIELLSLEPTSDYGMAIIRASVSSGGTKAVLYMVLSRPQGTWSIATMIMRIVEAPTAPKEPKAQPDKGLMLNGGGDGRL